MKKPKSSGASVPQTPSFKEKPVSAVRAPHLTGPGGLVESGGYLKEETRSTASNLTRKKVKL